MADVKARVGEGRNDRSSSCRPSTCAVDGWFGSSRGTSPARRCTATTRPRSSTCFARCRRGLGPRRRSRWRSAGVPVQTATVGEIIPGRRRSSPGGGRRGTARSAERGAGPRARCRASRRGHRCVGRPGLRRVARDGPRAGSDRRRTRRPGRRGRRARLARRGAGHTDRRGGQPHDRRRCRDVRSLPRSSAMGGSRGRTWTSSKAWPEPVRGRIIASGGISSTEDVLAAKSVGCAGAIVGRALYEGRIDLAATLRALGSYGRPGRAEQGNAWPVANRTGWPCYPRRTHDRGGQPGDPPQDPGSAVHHRAPGRNPPGRRPSSSRRLGGRLRAARAAPLRAGPADRRPSTTGDRPRACLGTGRDLVGRSPDGGRSCQRRGQRSAWGSTTCRVRCRPGCGGGPCGGPRARCCGLRDQGRASGGARRRAGGGWPPGVPVAAGPTPAEIRDLVLDDQRLRNELCWFAFDC